MTNDPGLVSKVSQLENEVALLQAALQEEQNKLRRAELKIQKLLAELFAPSSEKFPLDPRQINLALEVVLGQDAAISAPPVLVAADEPKEERKKRQARAVLPENVETVQVRLEPAEKVCPHCGKEKCEIGHEVTEELDYIPARLIKREIIRPKLACPCGEGTVVIAPLPPRVVEKGIPGPGLVSHVILSKYVDHLPLYRQQQIFKRLGVELSRKTMCDWVEKGAELLQAIVREMKKDLLSGDYLQIDETPVRVQDPEVSGKTATGYFWVYAQPAGDVIFEFSPTRGLDAPKAMLNGFSGTIQSDGYGVYEKLGLNRLGCWAHARRKFFEALMEDPPNASWFLEKIQRLYQVERKARSDATDPPERKRRREETSRPVLDEIKARLETLKATVLPRSLLGMAVGYALGQWEALTGYLADSRYEIDNNLIENAIRPSALGKKNWLFLGHPDAAWRSAVIYSLVVSCQRRGIDPAKYLADVLSRLPGMTMSQVRNLLPAAWKPA